MWLFVLFLSIPLIEIGLFIQIGGAIGLWPTLLVVIITAMLGTWLVRAQGALALKNLQSSFSQLGDPTEPLAHGAMILFSGALLLTPGFFTDAVGFLLLVPMVRSAAFRAIKARVNVAHFSMGGQPQAKPAPEDGDIIDGDFTEVQPTHTPLRGKSGWTKH